MIFISVIIISIFYILMNRKNSMLRWLILIILICPAAAIDLGDDDAYVSESRPMVLPAPEMDHANEAIFNFADEIAWRLGVEMFLHGNNSSYQLPYW